jgi:hypothetical protein
MSSKEIDSIYTYVLTKVKSPEFRNPIKDFIDENCSTFIDVSENTFEQGALFNEFTQLIDNLLDSLCKENNISEEMFLLASKKGLEDSKNKKYFEQLIAFNNYSYFKNLMTKRNLHLEKIAYEEMMKDKEKEVKQENKDNNEELKKLKEEQDKAVKGELEAALKMSLAAEEEAKKLKELEDAELEKAIKLSLLEQQKHPEQSPLIQAIPNLQIKMDPQPTEQPKQEPKPEPKTEEIKEIPKKLNPIDKVALKQKQLLEHDEKMKNIVQKKPVFSDKGNESLNKKLEEMEANKAKALQQYREMLMKMKKEKRHQEENEGTDVFSLGMEEKGKENPGTKISEEDNEKLRQKKLLAEKLKAKLKKK